MSEPAPFSFREHIDAPTEEYFFSRVVCDLCFSMLEALKWGLFLDYSAIITRAPIKHYHTKIANLCFERRVIYKSSRIE